MSIIKNLEELLKNDVLIEVNENIEELTQLVSAKNDKNAKAELKYMQDVKRYFDEVLIDIERGNLKEEDAIDILEGLEDMRAENQGI